MKVVCLDGETLYPADDLEKWSALSAIDGVDEVEIWSRTRADEVAERAADADIVLTNKTPLTAETFAKLPSLKFVSVLATGYNIVDLPAARAAGVVVSNVPSYSTDSVAQTVFALLLAITNRVEHYACENRQGRWAQSADFSYRDYPLPELSGKTMGIVGFGNIGSAVARIALAFGMDVLVYTSKDASQLPLGCRKAADIDEVFAASDVVSLHCPLTDSTRGLADRRRLGLMKPTAVLINTSRGPVVDEEALAEALCGGVLAAAGLDVLCEEPPRIDNPLLSLDNCYITPHIAWASDEARKRLFDITLTNIKSFLSGTPTNVVG